MGNKTDFCSILLLNEKPLCIFNIVVESFQVRHRLLFEILKLTMEVNVVVPFEQDGQVLFLDYSEANILAFKQLDSPIHVVTFGPAITFLQHRKIVCVHRISIPNPNIPRFANYAQSGRSLTGPGASNTSIVLGDLAV